MQITRCQTWPKTPSCSTTGKATCCHVCPRALGIDEAWTEANVYWYASSHTDRKMYPVQACSSCPDLFVCSSLLGTGGVLKETRNWKNKQMPLTRSHDHSWCHHSFTRMGETKIQEYNVQGNIVILCRSNPVLCRRNFECWPDCFICKPESNWTSFLCLSTWLNISDSVRFNIA